MLASFQSLYQINILWNQQVNNPLGVKIMNKKGVSACEARASHKKAYGVKAVAYCGPRTSAVNFCTNKEEPTTTYRYDTNPSPSVECPKGYYMESCVFWSRWTEVQYALIVLIK